MSDNDIESHIIESAIACIEKYGLKDATVRRIADEAGVNVAAINYYFRSKDQLIDRVMEKTLANAFDWSDFADSADLLPRERLAAILDHIIAGAQTFPEISRAHFYEPIFLGKTDTPVAKRLNEFLEHIAQDLADRGAAPNGQALRFAVVQAFSSIFSVGLLHRFLQPFSGAPLDDPATRRAYIDQLVEGVLFSCAKS